MAVTIRDVARVAGVSTATVSRALNVPGKVDEVTRARVVAVADELGYRPNRAARGLITGRTGNLGLLVPDLANPFFPGLVKGVQSRALEADQQLFVVDTDEDAEAESELVRQLAKQADGLVLCSPRMRPAGLREAVSLAPTVLVNRALPRASSVTFDNRGGAAQLLNHLGGLGHRRIGFLGGPAGSWSAAQRLRGLREAAASHRVTLKELGPVAPTFEGGLGAARVVLQARVSAVVAFNDLVAVGLGQALADRGVDVPGELSVAGFDDIPMAGMLRPSLTTVAMPLHQAGREAVELMLAHLADPELGPQRREMPTTLRERGSTGPAPRPRRAARPDRTRPDRSRRSDDDE
ncbi:LacI family DNA-binding transcriptional regulator [Kineosporia succinea]|uniref:DNA-binding LacI/PurR family transcriptional regulator n=1 Tax=Kineosporia succinea TaxID=84632 RepID=A0ABT9PEK9_9ACTN|nr:LacI family DNA-binding transcriptional regulator [Kineosporia succinea]MDP9831142.1 DNA-binding LacI/PurR family transcriptional regulator [Kineosporia succinea]